MTTTGAQRTIEHRPSPGTDAPLLSFGTQVVVDARAVAAELTNSGDLVAAFVAGLIGRIEPDAAATGAPLRTLTREFRAPGHAAEDGPLVGVSAVAALGDSAIMMHTFTDLSRVNLRLVSAMAVPIDLVIGEFKRVFAISRYRSHVSSRYRTFPSDDDQLGRFLSGERAYTRLRLDEPLAP